MPANTPKTPQKPPKTAVLRPKTAKNEGKNGHKVSDSRRLNISQLAFRFDLDRATCRKRIREAAIEPVEEREKEKFFLLDDRLINILDQSDAKLSEAKTRKMSADARIAEIKAMTAEGEMISVSGVKDYLQNLFTAMFKECTMGVPRRLQARLARAKTPAEINVILTTEMTALFAKLRADHRQFLPATTNATGQQRRRA